MPSEPARAALMRAGRGLILGLAVVLALGSMFGVLRFVPVHLPGPTGAALEVGEGPHRVFGYATLANPVVRFYVIGRPTPSEPARLMGFRREGRDLTPAPDEVVEGRLFTVDAAGLRRLDRYERVGERYDRLRADLVDGTEVWIYRRTAEPEEPEEPEE